jgi:small subunit ribosomal protein S4e
MSNRKHLSRLAMPKSWPIKRKGTKWIMKPCPGPHSLKYSMPLNLVLKELLNYSKTSRESKQILNKGAILVNNKVRKEIKFPVGFMDVISVPLTNEYFRFVINKRNKFCMIPIKKQEANLKFCKIIGKTILKKGKIQLNFYDGTNMIVDKNDYKINDTLVIEMAGEKPKIKKHLKFGKGSKVVIFEGKFVGYTGIVEDINKGFRNSSVIIKSGNKRFETSINYIFVVDDSISYKVEE